MKKEKLCVCCGREAETEIKMNAKILFCKNHSLIDFYMIDFYKKKIAKFKKQ